jgi:hypothetical protein
MEETDELVVGYLDDRYVLLDEDKSVVAVLEPGSVFQVWMGGEWQAVRLQSGGYRGCYYVTNHGERGRLALCMRVRLCEADVAPGEQDEVATTLERLRLAWIGKQAHSRVPLAGGSVCGEVREVTDWGMVLFVYTPPLNPVCVRVRFPIECFEEVLALTSEEQASHESCRLV